MNGFIIYLNCASQPRRVTSMSMLLLDGPPPAAMISRRRRPHLYLKTVDFFQRRFRGAPHASDCWRADARIFFEFSPAASLTAAPITTSALVTPALEFSAFSPPISSTMTAVCSAHINTRKVITLTLKQMLPGQYRPTRAEPCQPRAWPPITLVSDYSLLLPLAPSPPDAGRQERYLFTADNSHYGLA